MGRENLSLTFWEAFEKRAGIIGETAARLTGHGTAVSRLQKIRAAAPGAFKPQNLLGQIISNPAKGLANAAAVHSSASHKQTAMRWASRATLAGGGAAYLLHKADKDPDYNRRTR